MMILLVCSNIFALSAKTNFMKSDFLAGVEDGDKAALVMVYFGTTHADIRAKTITALTNLAAKRYPKLDVREAWTSRMIIRIMDKRGERIPTPLELMQQLKKKATHTLSCRVPIL